MQDELFIRFLDESGQEREIAITQPKFVIGRHSTADLSIANGKLSREHLKIEKLGDQFLVSDLGSSNGTQLNGEPLTEPVKIANGDRVDLGGGLTIEFVIRSFDPYAADDEEEEDEPDDDLAAADAAVSSDVAVGSAPAQGAETAASGGFSWGWFVVAPLLGIFLLAIIIGVIFILSSGPSTDIAETKKGGFEYSNGPVDDPSPQKTGTASSPSGTTTATGTDNSALNDVPQPSPANVGANGKVEQAAATFLRRVAEHDTTAFLTSDQAKKVSDKIKQIGSSTALADNINSARKSSTDLKNLSTKTGLTAQLLATAALTKLGNSRGDVLQTATSMSNILSGLRKPIGTELADDSLLLIAAYDQGERGDFQSLPGKIQQLTTKSPDSSRTIRTIWFLQKNGLINDAEFDFALRFLAIGTITQNPKDFGINADPLTL